MPVPFPESVPDIPSRKEVLDELARYQKLTIGSLSLDEIVDKLIDESDRGLVVVLGSLTEDLLLERILSRLPGLTKELKKDMTRSGGVLATWADRTTMALAMGLIDGDDADLLEILKSMRNACAHSRKHIDLQSPVLKNALSLMFDGETAEAVRTLQHPEMSRTAFFLAASYVWGRLRGQSKRESHLRVQRMFDDLRQELTEQATSLRTQLQPNPKDDDEAPNPQGQ